MDKLNYPEDKRYVVLDDGSIIGPKGTKLKPATNNSGYQFVAIGGVCKTIHRIVAKTFISNPNNYKCVNHKNGIKTDNRVENLEWITHSENHKHAFRHGLKIHKGENGPSHKLSHVQALVAKEALMRGFKTANIARYFKLSYSTINGIKQGRKWAHLNVVL